MSSILETILAGHKCPDWGSRTTESIALEILDVIADRKSIVGNEAEHQPCAVILGRAYESDFDLRYALNGLADAILKIFPNPTLEEPQPVAAGAGLENEE